MKPKPIEWVECDHGTVGRVGGMDLFWYGENGWRPGHGGLLPYALTTILPEKRRRYECETEAECEHKAQQILDWLVDKLMEIKETRCVQVDVRVIKNGKN